MPLQIPLQDSQTTARASNLRISVAVEVLLQMVRPTESFLTPEAAKKSPPATWKFFFSAVHVWRLSWPWRQRQRVPQEAKDRQQRLGHLLCPELSHGRRQKFFHCSFVLQAPWEDGKEVQVTPAKLPAALAGVDVAPEACGNASPRAAAREAHLDEGGIGYLEDIQHFF